MSTSASHHVPLIDLDDPGPAGDALREMARQRGRVVNFHRMIANSPVVARGVTGAVYGLWNESRLGRRLVELVILRVSRVCESEYEWAQHARLGRLAGVPEEQLDAIADWRGSDAFDDAERALLALVDASLERHVVDDELVDTVARFYEADHIIDIITTAGLYRTVAVLLRSFSVPLDDDVGTSSVSVT